MRRHLAVVLLLAAALSAAGCGAVARSAAKVAARGGGQAAPKVAPKVVAPAGGSATRGGRAVTEGAQQVGGAALGGDSDGRRR